jgi:MYXO-CTERM domain-containing protein
MHNLGLALVALSQGVPFFHAGDELLRSKSMDRNSYNSGDWFNRIDWTYQSNNWGVGLPPAGDNQDKWAIMKPLLADPALKPTPAHIQRALEHFEEMIRIRKSSEVFRLRTGGDIERRVRFENTGPNQLPGLIVMTIEGDKFARLGEYEQAVVLFNGADEEQRVTVASLKGARLELHPVLKDSTDPIVRGTAFDPGTGSFTVPARTTAVFVQNQTPFEPVPISGEAVDVGGCAAGGGAAFSALALLGLGGLLRSRRRKP